ncbi:carbon-nitrogen hydrolase family protein [Microbacterium sp. B19]|uniref:carbon-nitrogen hydrolase family protein n=1 Tax=Microbacterium sp. B19 TaxID=96765 RepID=UPI00034C3454|nr:carbon-nitrogen hydrolase family protein [Microbacterium sp. B19]
MSTRIAAVQAEPGWFDLPATVAKTVDLIAEAAANGAEIIAFPETWLPGYPIFLWTYPVPEQIPHLARYHAASPTVDGPEVSTIREAAAAHGITVVLGLSEQDHGSLYMAQLIIGPTGDILLHRRKLKPTHAERTLFGEGDGGDLQVIDSAHGRLGALNCWEHLQPLVKFSMYAQHEQIHVAGWPCFGIFAEHPSLGWEPSMAVSRTYALEGGAFVVVSTQILSETGAQNFLVDGAPSPIVDLGGGYARVYGPDGALLTEPLDPHTEGLVYADIDLAAIDIAKKFADPVGHYSRPDVFTLTVDRSARTPATLSDVSPVEADKAGAVLLTGEA